MIPFFLIRYVCTETSVQRRSNGCNCSLREKRPEILCAVMATDKHEAAKKLGGRCGGLTLRMDPDLDPDHDRSSNLSDCTLYNFIPGKTMQVVGNAESQYVFHE